MSEKHNRNIFDIFEASLVVLCIRLVKLHFTKWPLAAMFLNQICPKSLGLPPSVILLTVESLKTIGQSNLECTQALKMAGNQLGNMIVDIKFFRSCHQ